MRCDMRVCGELSCKKWQRMGSNLTWQLLCELPNNILLRSPFCSSTPTIQCGTLKSKLKDMYMACIPIWHPLKAISRDSFPKPSLHSKPTSSVSALFSFLSSNEFMQMFHQSHDLYFSLHLQSVSQVSSNNFMILINHISSRTISLLGTKEPILHIL